MGEEWEIGELLTGGGETAAFGQLMVTKGKGAGETPALQNPRFERTA